MQLSTTLLILIALLVPHAILKAQTVGQTRNNNGAFEVYDGTNFDTPDYGSLGGCSAEGQMQFSGTTLRFCDGSTWHNLDSGVNNGSCSTAGEIRRNTTWLEFCNGTNWRKINPTHINGACTNEGPSNNLCNDGTANDVVIPDTTTQWRWRCDGLYGGSNSGTCYKTKPVNGSCNNASNYSCAAGTPSNLDTVTDRHAIKWKCVGSGGGSTANCSRTPNNECASPYNIDWAWNSASKCRHDPSEGIVSDSYCCAATKPAVAINGACGSAASGGKIYPEPTSNKCSSGTYTNISDTGADWRWQCTGSGGGSTATCTRPIDCNYSNWANHKECTSGSGVTLFSESSVEKPEEQCRNACDTQSGTGCCSFEVWRSDNDYVMNCVWRTGLSYTQNNIAVGDPYYEKTSMASACQAIPKRNDSCDARVVLWTTSTRECGAPIASTAHGASRTVTDSGKSATFRCDDGIFIQTGGSC